MHSALRIAASGLVAGGLAAGIYFGASAVTNGNESRAMAFAQAQHDANCSDFAYQEDAQAYFESNGYSAGNDPERLDDATDQGNGIACESLPKRPVVETPEPIPGTQTAEPVAPSDDTMNTK